MFKNILASLLALFTSISFAAVDINKATVADLDSIKGIGPGTSAKIVEQRKVAKFKDWDDLVQRVSGIGDKRAAKPKDDALRHRFQRRGARVGLDVLARKAVHVAASAAAGLCAIPM